MARKSRKNLVLPEIKESNGSSVEKTQETANPVVPDIILPQVTRLATAAYIRLSVENGGNESDGTLTTQMKLVHDFIRSHPDLELTDTYADNGFTGTNFDRPEFERLMGDVRSGKIQCIVVKDLSRFGRDYLETGYYIENIFPRLNVRFLAVTDNFDSSRPEDMESLALPIKNLVNSFYARDISKKISSYYESKRRRGEHATNCAPYGLKITDDGKGYVPDEETAPFVRAAFLWTRMGVSRNEIMRRFDFLKVPTPRQNQRLASKKETVRQTADDGLVWSSGGLQKILSNRAYIGDLEMGKTRKALYKGIGVTKMDEEDWTVIHWAHEAILLKEDFDAVQEIIGKSREDRKTALIRSQEVREQNPDRFRGLVYCAGCGRKMIYDRRACGGEDFSVHMCTARKTEECTGNTVQDRLLSVLVMEQIRALLATMGDRKKLLKNLTQGSTERNLLLSMKRRCGVLQGQIERAEERKGSLYEDFVSGLLDEEEYRGMKEHYIGEIQRLKSKMQDVQRQARQLEFQVDAYMEQIKELEGKLDGTEFDAALVKELVERIDVFNNGAVKVKFKCDDVYEKLMLTVDGAKASCAEE